MIADAKGLVDQASLSLAAEGVQDYPAMSKLRELFTADWKQRLIRAGLAWSAHVGGISAGADVAPVVGGGNGTTVDTSDPEFVIGVPAGYYMIVMEAHVACYYDPVTDNGIENLILFADRTQSPVSQTDTGTAVTPVNLLDGAAVFPGTCWKAATAGISANPVCSEILDYECTETGCTTGGTGQGKMKMDYMPEAPSILAGPCQVVLCWGGIAASGTSGMGVVKVAVVPASYFPTS